MIARPSWLSEEYADDLLGDLLSDADRQILSTVDRFILERVEPNAREIDRNGTFPRELYQEAAALGLFALAMPQAYGGIEVRLLTQFLVTERLTRSSPGFAVTVSTT